MANSGKRRTYSIVKNQYRDSVSLMQLSSKVTNLEGVDQASIVVASEGNLGLLRDSGLIAEELEAGPSDLVIAVEGDDAVVDAAVDRAQELLLSSEENDVSGVDPALSRPRSIEQAMARPGATAKGATAPDASAPGGAEANFALISTPGDYAATEARKALSLGLNVMIFSNNVSEEDEISLKRYAGERDLLVMGPDCGTSIINGIPLAFANEVRRGPIGVVAASGTGLQQVTCLVDRLGSGISQAIGTGGRDLHESVGGMTMLQALAAFETDSETEVIVLVSKPPAQVVAERLVSAAEKLSKPVVINFLGPNAPSEQKGNIWFVPTLEEAARAAHAIVTNQSFSPGITPSDDLVRTVSRKREEITGSYIRGLFSGGTFCYESLILISRRLGLVYSNTPIDEEYRLRDVRKSKDHTLIDLGDDEFTRGRPHPMIDHSIRNERIVSEAGDPEVKVILFDVVLGHGSHPDPASEMIPAIEEAKDAAGREVLFIASVCGTEGDPQALGNQERRLEEVGVVVASSNARASLLATEAIAASNSSVVGGNS